MKTSQIINHYQAGLLTREEADARLKEVCSHEELEYEFMYDGDPWPMFTGAHCLDCEEDFPAESFSEAERYALEADEAENMVSSRIESAIEYDQDLRAGLL